MSSETSAAALEFGKRFDAIAKCPLNHLARVAGLALLDAEKRMLMFDTGKTVHMRFVGEGDVNVSVNFRGDEDPICLDGADAWDAMWSRETSTRIVVSAIDHAKVPACNEEFTRLGRAVTFREPCASYELPVAEWDRLCCGPPGAAGGPGPWVTAEVLDTADVSASYGLPAGFVLGPLRPENAEIVNDTWKYKTAKSIEMVRASIASRPTAGLWTPQGQLISWIVLRYDGSMGLLHTLPEHRGKGYARHVVKFISLAIRRWQYRLRQAAESTPIGPASEQAQLVARLADMLIPYCHIKLGNVQSEAVFKNLGFVEVNRVTWVISSALAPRFKLRPLNLSSPHELEDMLAMINVSYKVDDAFWVDQTRTSEDVLRSMCKTGVFYVGYRMDTDAADQAGVGLDSRAFSHGSLASWKGQADVPADAATAHRAELSGDSRELLCSVYVSHREEAIGGGAGAEASGQQQAHGQAGSPSDTEPSQPISSVATSRVASLSLLTINTAYKRLGLGQRVLDFAMATAAAAGAHAMEAHVVSVKPWLLSFYCDRNGFRVVGQDPWPAEMEHELIVRPVHFHRTRKVLK